MTTSRPPVACELIPFIDDSGSSSCASSTLGDDHCKGGGGGDEDDDDDTASLNRLLDDAASREFSFNGLHDDLASLSCGYVSQDAFSDEGGGTAGRKERTRELYSVASSSARSSPRTSSHSSIKSSDALDDDTTTVCFAFLDGSKRDPPSFPPPLPPCTTCEASSCCSTDSSSNISSCPTCSADCDVVVNGDRCHSESTKRSSRSSCSDLPEDEVIKRCPDDDSKRKGSSTSSSSSTGSCVKSCDSHHLKSEISNSMAPIEDDSLKPLTQPCLETKVLTVHSEEDASLESIKDVYLVASTPVHELKLESSGLKIDLTSHESVQRHQSFRLLPSPIALPQKLLETSMSVPTTPGSSMPHHYISSTRVSSMRGAADMGGALVARVATFLRSQYKSLESSPFLLPWCPRFRLLVSDYETTLVQIPLAPHLKVPNGPVEVSSILKSQVQMSINEAVLEDRPKRVLVEGETGYCNSNLCFKMAHDWTIIPQESYVALYSLVFVITLRDFRGGSLFSYMCKEILPRHILSKEAMSTLWSHLLKIEDKVLFLLVGYDELCEDEAGDLLDLINGSMFPQSSVILTSRSGSGRPLPTSLHRRFFITGFNSQQTKALIQRYFCALGKPDSGSEVMSLVAASQEKYGDLPRCPVMCLALAVLYEDFGGKLPSRLTDLFMALLKHMVRRNLLRRGEPMCYGVLPDKYTKLFNDFGKLALESLKAGCPYFTGSDLKTKVPHGGEVVSLGILVRMKSMSKLNKKEYYAPAHISLLEFIAAFYLSSLVHTYTQLQSQLDNLAQAFDLCSISFRNCSGIMILRYLVGILGRNAYLVFNIVSQMGISQRVFFLLLRESGMSQMNVIEMCKHVAGREHVVIQTNSIELEDWGRLLYSPDCTLDAVEVLLDFDGSSRDSQEAFFTSLSFNESVKSIKLTCLVGGEFGETEVTRLVSYVRTVLTKRRLESFEMVITSLEDSTTEILNPVVDMVCDTLAELAPLLTRLVLAMELDSPQVVRLCAVLKHASQVQVLHLPHLSCGLAGLQAIADLLKSNPLVSLNLSGALSSGTPVEERSAGAANNSSPHREDVSSAPPAFWNFVDARGNVRSVFNSLPRSFYQSIPRRSRLDSTDKRNSDSTLLQKTCLPPPACSPHVHTNGFHEIFSTFRLPSCKVCHLNLSKCTLGAEDLVCLGETVRFSKCLSSLRMEGLSRMAELIPILIALQENKSLQLLDISSPQILLGDAAFQVTLNSLMKNKTLRFLVLNGWTFQLETARSMNDFLIFLSSTDLQHLDLTGCQISINDGPLGNLHRQDDVIAALQQAVPPLKNNSLAFINLDNFEVHINSSKVILRGPQLMFLLRHLPKLVDISLCSNLGSEVVDDASTFRVFSLIPTAFPCLRRLSIAGWVFSLDNCEKVLKTCGKILRRSQLREISMNGVEVRDSSGHMEHYLLAALTSNLHHLSLLSLSGLSLTTTQMAVFGKSLRDKMIMSQLDLETKGLDYTSLKSLRQAVTEGGKCDFSFEGGSNGIYKVKKIDRKEKILGKWVCVSSRDRDYDS